MSALIKYDQARHALAACRSVDEIKDMRDKSEALRLYAKQAHDTELEQWAAEIKLRAQRAIGEISAALEKQKNQAALPTGGKSKSEALADAGISTSTANRYEKLAAIPEPVIDDIISKSKEIGKPVSVKTVLAQVAPKPEQEAPATSPSSAPAAAPIPAAAVASLADSDNEAPAPEVDPVQQLLADYNQVKDDRDDLQARVIEIEALLACDDLTAEVQKWKANFEALSGRNRGLTAKLNEIEPEADSMRKTLKEIRLVLGVDRNQDIVPALKTRRAA